MNTGGTAVIILAAGFSSRMGELKPLLRLGDATVADHIMSTFLQNRVRVYLVVGHRESDVLQGINTGGIEIVQNSDYKDGMFTSVQAGVRHLDAGCERFFIMPVDIPLVRPATVARLLREAEERPDSIIYPVFDGRRGHPPLIPATLAPSILEWKGDAGLKGALSGYSSRAVEVTVPDSNVLFDIDTPEDYRELLVRFNRIAIPSGAERRVIRNDICKMPPNIVEHCNKVTGVASRIAGALTASGVSVDTEAIIAAAELHDLARVHPKHEIEGARMLESMGFKRAADIVAVHMDMPDDDSSVPLEAKIVFLADKFVEDTNVVSLEERYNSSSAAHAANPEVATTIEGRKQRALKVKRDIESLLHAPIEQLLFS